MKVENLKQVIEWTPFRPFAIRLTNGHSYSINSSRDIAASKDYSTIFWFGDTGFVLIDAESIVEIIK